MLNHRVSRIVQEEEEEEGGGGPEMGKGSIGKWAGAVGPTQKSTRSCSR